MTAEVIIGNGFGIALAADEVTTAGHERTYDGASKIFGLPAPHALAVVHAGSVFMHGLPHDSMIWDWISSLPAQRLSTTQAYADSYVEYVQTRLGEVTEETELTRTYLHHLDRMLRNELKDLKAKGELTPKVLRKHFTMLRDRWKRPLTPSQQRRSDDVFRHAGRGSVDNLLERMAIEDGPDLIGRSSIEGVIDERLKPLATEKTVQLAYEWARLKFGQAHPRMDSSGTLSFVGYGEKDAVPAVTIYEIEGFFAGHVYHRELKVHSAERCGPSFILFESLGQSREIHRLLEQAGTSPRHSEHIVSEHVADLQDKRNLMDGIANSTVTPLSTPAVAHALAEITPERIRDQIIARMEKEHQRNFDKFRLIAASLSLSHLTSLAGRLVLLENLAHEIRGSLPTVGAKVMMATITRSEGFQWAKVSVGDVV